MDYADIKQRLCNSILPSLEPEIYSLNDYLAEYPELSGQEYRSSQRMVALLRQHGLKVEYPFAGFDTAFRAQINPGLPRRTALLAEYDALPELGHACGHCASGSASLLAALALHKIAAELDFSMDIIGTPDEEMHGGKCYMSERGFFNGYDFVAMAHMGSTNAALISFLALDGMLIKFRGLPAHAAQAPEEGRNALNAARLFFDAIDMMRQHIIPEARLHGYIRRGGSAANVVPDYTEIHFIARAPKRRQLDGITAWVHVCVKAAALATRTAYEIEPVGLPFHDLYISPGGLDLMNECFAELEMETLPGQVGMTGSSDIGNVDYICPAFHPMVSIGRPLTHHTHEFAAAMTNSITHQAISSAAKLLLSIVLKLYTEPQRLAKIKKQHQEYRK